MIMLIGQLFCYILDEMNLEGGHAYSELKIGLCKTCCKSDCEGEFVLILSI